MASNYKSARKKLEEMMTTDYQARVIEDESGKKVDNYDVIKPTLTRSETAEIAPVMKRESLINYTKGNFTDLAPVKKNNNPLKTETFDLEGSGERTWFQTGAFDDGYDFGDVTKTIFNTASGISSNANYGFTKGIEGVLDLGLDLVSKGADAVGANGVADTTRKIIQKDLSSYVTTDIGGLSGLKTVSNLLNGSSLTQAGIDTKEQANKRQSNSVLGDKSNSLVQSAGQMGVVFAAQSAGVPWWLTTGAMSYGNEVEQAYNSGATSGEAFVSGVFSASGEVLTEALSGGMSKFGIGGKALTDGLVNKIAGKIEGKLLNNLTKYGFDVIGEGAEEVVSELISNLGRKLSYEDEKTWKEMFASEEAIDNYIEAFIGGAVISGGMNSVGLVNSTKEGRDFKTGLTDNEQKVVDSEISKRTDEKKKTKAVEDEINRIISERESTLGTLTDEKKAEIRKEVYGNADSIDFSNTELTKREIKDIEKAVDKDLKKGNFTVDSIEETFGLGETNSRIKEIKSKLNELDTKFKENPNDETVNNDEYKKLVDELNALEKTRAERMGEVLKGNSYLDKSYREEVLRGQNFTYEANAKDSEYKKSLAKDFEKYANDSTATHELFDYMSKIQDDKGIQISVVNNKALESMGQSIEGKDINGFVVKNEDGTQKLVLNIDSKQTLEKIVGHETTHLLEGTAEYKELQDMVKQYATTKGDYNAKLKEVTELYNGIKDADVNSEVTAVLLEDYLFNDTEFINSLSVEKPSIFEKIYNEIKHLYKLATAGSREARELEKVKKAFEKAYKQNTNNVQGDTNYSLGYHAGDLGKSERLATQGKSRGTGHFGTGTYFVGNEETLAKEGYGDRPVEKVDFDKYNLFKVNNNDTGYMLHDALKVIDGGISEEFVNYEKNYEFPPLDANKDTVNDFNEFDNAVFNLKKVFGFKTDKIFNALDDVVKYQEQNKDNRYNYDEYLDSYATVFMKSMGYEGIDVRGTNLDDTQYGSVIYDLKGEDLARKNEIGTAKYSVSEKNSEPIDINRISKNELNNNYSLSHNSEIAEGQNKYIVNNKSFVSPEDLKSAQEITSAMVDVMMKYSDILPEDKIGKVLTKNGSYDRSVENTTICVRTLAYNQFVDKVQEQIGRPMTQMESFLVSQKLYDIATDPQCLYCYVSLDRKAYNEMLLRYMSDRDTVIDKYNKSDKLPETVDALYNEFLNGRKNTKQMKDRFNNWINNVDNGVQLLSLADIATDERQAQIKADGGALAAQLADARKYAQSASWSKIQKDYVAYRDEILKLGDRVVKNLNEHYGLRWYSFSDYSAAFIVENMQQITDASIRGLKGLSYTKDTDYAEIFAPTGMNINISVFVNRDANGNFYIDEKQSADFEKAKELRAKYSNVGIVATVTDDEALRWAGSQEWSDVIIPFHIVRTGTDVAEYYKWLNYTSESADTVADSSLWDAYLDSLNKTTESSRKKVSKNIYPNEHLNNKDVYLNLCDSRGLKPRFARFAGEDWYMKLVNETRLPANETVPLQPTYNLEAAKDSFQRFVEKGGYEGGWYRDGVNLDAEVGIVANDILAGKKANEVDYGRQDGFSPENLIAGRKTNRNHQYSISKTDNKGRELSTEQQEYFMDSKVRDKNGNLRPVYHYTNNEFTTFEDNGKSQNSTRTLGDGYYISTSEKEFSDFGSNKMEMYANVSNPFEMRLDEYEAKKIYDKYFSPYVDDDVDVYEDHVIKSLLSPIKVMDYIKEAAKNGKVKTSDVFSYLGYDGVHDGSEWVVFDSNQIKNVDNTNPTDNPDIRNSLSFKGQTFARDGGTFGSDIKSRKLEEIAPVKETVNENIDNNNYDPAPYEVVNRENEESFNALTDEDVPAEKPDTSPDYWSYSEPKVESPLEDRDWIDVGKRSVKAYQYEHPEVKPYFKEAAENMLYDLSNSIRGERIYIDTYNSGYNPDVNDQNTMVKGIKRHTTDDIADLLDSGYSYADIEKGLNAIIDDNGKENIAVAKRIEFALDERLRKGYKDIWGEPFPANKDYIDLLEGQRAAEYASSIPIDDKDAPPERINPDIAPVKETPKQETAPIQESAPVKETSNESSTSRIINDAPTNEEIAEAMVEEPKTQRQRNRRRWAIAAANFLDKGVVFENLSLKYKNRNLMGKWDYTLTSESRAQNIIGNGHREFDANTKQEQQTSKSLNDIREEVGNSGKTKDFYNYMYHKHNVDRMSLESRYENTPNKAVFGDSVTSEISQGIVDKYEAQNPEFLTWAQDVYDYVNADRQALVDAGVISQETADLWQEMYPHYVPIRRVDAKGANIDVPLDTRRTGVNAPVRRATGGNSDILPLFDTMAQRTVQTQRAISKNSFGVELMNTLNSNAYRTATSVDEVIDSVDSQESLLQNNDGYPTFTVFKNGERYTFDISQNMYDALSPVSDSSLLSKTFAAPNKISNFHRGVLTQYNPIFALTNGIKDTQDVLMNSQHPVKTYAKFGEAFAQVGKKGYWYREYISNGGEQNSYYDSQENTFKTEDGFTDNMLNVPPLKQIAQMNDFIETIPRLAEYIASRESGRSVEVSMLDAARVTTNFKAGGDVTKFLNRNGATFLNASVQGAMQQVRNVREAQANGVRGWASLAIKTAAAGLPAMILNSLLWDDDEDYEELSDYVKLNYYIVSKNDDGTFIRIPKGRALAVIQNGMEQMKNLVTGDDEADLSQFIDLVINNLAPNNPLTNNVVAPFVQVAQNKSWFGGNIVPTSLQYSPTEEQYDESTDSFSRWLGETFGVSPMKANYLIDQYSGGLGDVVLPFITPKATSDADSFGEQLLAPLKSKFTTNSTMNNQNVSDFWDKIDELATNVKKSDHTDNDVLSNKYFNSVKSEISELTKQKKEVQSSDMPNSEKYNEVLRIQKQINELAKNALADYEDVSITGNYATVSNRQYKIDSNGDWTKLSNEQINRQNEVSNLLGVSASDYWNADKDTREAYTWAVDNPDKYTVSRAVSNNVITYKGYTSDIYDLKADKDSNGKSISGSRKEKVINYINNLDADYGAKLILYKSEYTSDDSVNNDIIEYLNGRNDITYNDMVSILTQLDMKVDENGNIYW